MNVTFVCCVESGELEQQTVRLAASLRRWGGRFANCPLLAITPRLGPPLRRSTKDAFERWQVHHVRHHVRNRYAWYPFMNKVTSLVVAERLANTDTLVWLDSDILVMDEPWEFELSRDVQIAACPASRHGGTTGPDDPNEPVWRAMCDQLGLNLESLPWLETTMDAARVRFYFNAGVFAYRRSSGFLKSYHDSVMQVLDSGLMPPHGGVGLLEQAAFALAIIRHNMSFSVWPDRCNFNVGLGLDQYYQSARMRQAADNLPIHPNYAMLLPVRAHAAGGRAALPHVHDTGTLAEAALAIAIRPAVRVRMAENARAPGRISAAFAAGSDAQHVKTGTPNTT